MAQRARLREPVRLVEAFDPTGGGRVWVALSRSRFAAAYVLREGADGRYLCACPRFGFRGTCSHVEALYARLAPRS